jgi:MbtH protein
MHDENHPASGSSTIDGESFKVLINDEQQHSIWPAGMAAPAGWNAVGPIGSKADCASYIDAQWTDMRPLSLREAMDGAPGAKSGPKAK